MYRAGPAEMRMRDLINDFRAGRRLDPLGLSRSLGEAAEHKGWKIASQGYWTAKSGGVLADQRYRATLVRQEPRLRSQRYQWLPQCM